MKKFVKVCLIIALACVVLGTAVTVGAVSAGGVREVKRMVMDGELSFRAGAYWDDDDWVDDDDRDDDWDRDENEVWDGDDDWDDLDEKSTVAAHTPAVSKIQSGSVAALSAKETAQVQKLEVQFDGGEVQILSAEDGCIRAEADDPYGKVMFRLEDNTFYIVDTMKQHKWWKERKRRTIRLYLPKDRKFEDVEFEIAGGVLEAESVWSKNVSLDVGAGKIWIENLNCDRLEGNVGAGSMELQGSVTEDADFDIGMGQLLYAGSIGNRTEVDCGMGEALFELTQKEMDFNYDVSVSMGEIVISDMVFGGVEETQRIDYKAARNMELDCSMGKIGLSFRN